MPRDLKNVAGLSRASFVCGWPTHAHRFHAEKGPPLRWNAPLYHWEALIILLLNSCFVNSAEVMESALTYGAASPNSWDGLLPAYSPLPEALGVAWPPFPHACSVALVV